MKFIKKVLSIVIILAMINIVTVLGIDSNNYIRVKIPNVTIKLVTCDKNKKSFIISPQQTKTQVVYNNTEYGFKVNLPETWKGYTIVNSTWDGYDTMGEGVIKETGPLISIRHPLWTEENPRQDIPIMVFTIEQWNAMNNDEFHIGAAPINPSELARNSKYVFGLPARYNFAFLTGFEEVQQIIDSKAVVATENISK